MPSVETSFNAIGGVMQAYQESINELQMRIAQLQKENEGLRQAVADLGKQLLKSPEFEQRFAKEHGHDEPPHNASDDPVF